MRVLFGIALLGIWQLASIAFGTTWISAPSLIGERLYALAVSDLYIHVFTTAAEIAIGLALGAALGVACGLWIGSKPLLGLVLRPVIIAFYSVPLIALTPLFILWFGLDMKPKIVMIVTVVFFLLFFNTVSGVQKIDPDLVASLLLMGSTRREVFQKVIAPASMPWIMTGLKIALPYSLMAATTGEMLAARRGVGFLVSRAATQFDMTGLYVALVVLVVMGLVLNEAGELLEKRVLRWRDADVH
jgi:NitT/TauT family transport system permease protein